MTARKLLLLFTFTFLCSAGIHAQNKIYWGYSDYDTNKREIATDYNSCFHGVKDSTGAWVIQPQYEDIVYKSGRYIIMSGGKFGLLDYNGAVMIPATYQMLRPIMYYAISDQFAGYYSIMQSGKMGLVDSVNHVIVPPMYEDLRLFFDSTITAKKTKRTYDFYNLKGEVHACPWKSKKLPMHEASHAFSVAKKGLFHTKYGLVNDKGEVLKKRKYRYIDGNSSSDAIKIGNRNSYGYISSAGKTLWPMVFETKGGYYNWSYDYVTMFGVGPASINGKQGLITLEGDTLLSFIYDNISSFNYDSPALWRVEKDSLQGIFDPKKGWIVPLTSSPIVSAGTFLNESDSSALALFVTSRNGKWGAITSNGQEVVPFEYDEVLSDFGQTHIFRKGNSLVCLSVKERYTRNYVLSLAAPDSLRDYLYDSQSYDETGSFDGNVPDNNVFNVYEKEGVKVFYNSKKTHNEVNVNGVTVSLSQGKTYGMLAPDSIVIASCFSVIPVAPVLQNGNDFSTFKTPKLIGDHFEFSYEFALLAEQNKGDRIRALIEPISIRNGSTYFLTNHGDILKENGMRIINGDSLWLVQNKYHPNDGSLYFSAISGLGFQEIFLDTNGHVIYAPLKETVIDFNDRYAWTQAPGDKYPYKYQLMDRRSKELLLGKKSYSLRTFPIWDSITLYDTEKEGVRLFNLNKRGFLTSFGADEIIPLNFEGSLFAIRTCNGHMGAIDASGKMILDTIYTAITRIQLDSTIYPTSSNRQDYFNNFYHFVVFYNDAQSVMLNTSDHKLSDHTQYSAELWTWISHSVPGQDFEKTLNDSFYTYNSFRRRLTIHYPETYGTEFLPWQKQCLIDSVVTPMRNYSEWWSYYYSGCKYCRKKRKSISGYDWTKHLASMYNYGVSYRSDSLMCFQVNEFQFISDRGEKSTFSTVMMFNDGPHQMTLDSLFNPASDWKNFIINSLLSYVNSHQGIEGDCHNPAGIPKMLNELFEVTPNGLLLYPDGFTEHSVQLALLIPWKDAEPYLRNDIKSRLPMKP